MIIGGGGVLRYGIGKKEFTIKAEIFIAVRFLAIVLTAVSMSVGIAHLLELPNKIDLPAADYLMVQQNYRGWHFLGVPLFGALIATAILTVMERRRHNSSYFSLASTFLIALALIVFFTYTLPANQETHNWTMLPHNWQHLRQQWEYSHAVGAGLFFAAFVSLALSTLLERP